MSTLTTGEFTARALIVIGLAALGALCWEINEIFVLIFGGLVLAVVLRSMMRLRLHFTPLRGRWALLIKLIQTLYVQTQ